jgi:hypothetical protein
MTKPILFIDVDGPLNPYNASGRAARRMGYDNRRIFSFRVFLKRSHGQALRNLPFELVWGTTWEDEANTYIGPRLGLPDLPVCRFEYTAPHKFSGASLRTPANVYYKTPSIVQYAEGRPFAWIDDEITDADRRYVLDHHCGPALLYWVDPAKGLANQDFEALDWWARSIRKDDYSARDNGPSDVRPATE